MTLRDRAEAYAAAFPEYPASHLQMVTEGGEPTLYGRWVLGNNYRAKSELYGAYPPSYLERVMSMFRDVSGNFALHAFSGSLPPGDYSRVDLIDRCKVPDLRFHQADICDPTLFAGRAPFRLVLADPPYSADDAKQYGTPTLDRRKALAAIARFTEPGGHLCWLDTTWPMHKKSEWRTVGRIAITRSTNHRVRDLTLFERRAA
jgi:hypothetical protein